MKKVLHLLSTTSFSGAENVVCQIINMYKNDKNFEMFYCSPNGPIKKSIEDRKIIFVPIEKLNRKNLKKIIEKYNIDILHAHDIKASVLASSFSKKLEVISHVHTNSAAMKKFSIKSFIYMLTLNKYKHIYWVSKSTYSEYKFVKKAQSKSTVLYNIIDTKEVLKKSSLSDTDKYDIIYVGRLTEVKNPVRLVEVVNLVKKKIPNIQMALIGQGHLQDELVAMIDKLNLNDNIHMLGYISNPYPYMANSKIMLMTSIFEGTPMCALESMSLGLPIVSTPTDGLADLIDNAINGYLGTSNEELADCIVKLLKNKKKYLEFSNNSKTKSNLINDNKLYKQQLDIYY